jgi:hypothetical protein
MFYHCADQRANLLNCGSPLPPLNAKKNQGSPNPSQAIYFVKVLNVIFNVDFFPGARVSLFTFTFPDSTHTIF